MAPSKAIGLIFVFLAAAIPAAARTFLMGTTNGADFFSFGYENPEDKDFFSVHVDDFLGIPWPEFQNNTPPPAAWAAKIQTLQQGAATAGKIIYLALGPLTNRKTLAGKVDASGQKIENWAPTDASGCYPFAGDPNASAYQTAYVNYAKYMIDRFHPKFMTIVIEMNIQFDNCPSQKDAFIQWYSGVYRSLKQSYPGLPIFPTYQSEFMYGIVQGSAWCGGNKTDASLAACFQQRLDDVLTIPADRLAFSSYPLVWKVPPVSPDTYATQVPLDDMLSRVKRSTTRKIWFSETGWQGVQLWTSYAHAAPASSCGVIAITTPTLAGEQYMADYLGLLLTQAQEKQLEAVVWTYDRDLMDGAQAAFCPCPTGTTATCIAAEQLYQVGGTSVETLFRFFANMGLRYNDGTPRTVVHNLWTSFLSQPYSPVPGANPNALDAIQVYPNPLRPALGHTGMHFTQLPPAARVQIYTLAGEKVNDLAVSAVGIATWDGTNAAGRKAASGVYVVLVQMGEEKRTIKVAVQR